MMHVKTAVFWFASFCCEVVTDEFSGSFQGKLAKQRSRRMEQILRYTVIAQFVKAHRLAKVSWTCMTFPSTLWKNRHFYIESCFSPRWAELCYRAHYQGRGIHYKIVKGFCFANFNFSCGFRTPRSGLWMPSKRFLEVFVLFIYLM